MATKSIQGNTDIAKKIKMRRNELGLTIEEAAKRAGVGTKTWCRYEAGESSRQDNYKGVCKALNWINTVEAEIAEKYNMSEWRNSGVWSSYLEENYGEIAAASFAIGSDILLDQIQDDMVELTKMSAHSHIGQIDISFLADMLPRQFCMKYDYDFLYVLYVTLIRMRQSAHDGMEIKAYSVLEELIIYLTVQNSQFLLECSDIDLPSDWNEWVFDLFGDMDIISFLFSDSYLPLDHTYHFDHWMDKSFWEK